MKKTFILGLGLAIAISLSACGAKPQTSQPENAPQGGLVVEDNDTLMGWLKKSEPVACRIAGPEGQMQIKMKNAAVRIEGIPYFSANSNGVEAQAANGVILTLGDMTYMWDIATLQGTKMSNRQTEEAAVGATDTSGQAETQKDWSEMVGEWEAAGYQYECNETNLDDELFVVPSNVEFMDLDALLTGIQENLNPAGSVAGQPEIPAMPDMTGITETEGLNQEDVEKLLEEQAANNAAMPETEDLPIE